MMFWSSKSGINSKYSFSSSPTFTAEPWSVYTGRPKSSTSSAPGKVSIFMFDKKRYENYLLNYGIIKSKSSSHDKQLIQEGYEILRQQVSNLAKLKHPNVLTLIEPLEEHSKNFLFVTECVTGSLDSIFGASEDQEEEFLKGHLKDGIVIQRGILQVVNGIDFIHNRAHSVHLSIQPNSIFINENSDWKISGLGHLIKLPDGSNSTEYFFPQYDPRIPPFIILDLNYTAPEVVFENNVSCKSDYFSLGLLINFLYCGKNQLFRAENSLSQYKDEYAKFERKISSVSWNNVFSKLPEKLVFCMPKLMNRDVYARYDNITDFMESEFFQAPLIKTLNFLDDLPAKSNEERAVFLEGLVNLLPEFPVTLLQRKFLPILLGLLEQLCSEKVLDTRCISKNLEVIIKIGATFSQLTFSEKVYPVIISKTNFTILLKSSNVTLIDSLTVLKEKVKSTDFLERVLKPLLTYVLQEMDGESAVIPQEKLLENLPLLLDAFDFPSIKKFLLPNLSKLFTKTTSLVIKTTCVSSFESLIDHKCIDSYTCTEDILPLFKQMKTRDSRILMKSLKLFEKVPKLITDETALVEDFLPLIWNYSMSSTLTASQYRDFTKVINTLCADIQRVHMSKLSNENELESMTNTNAFSKIIQTPAKVPAADIDNQASKKLSIPAIKPQKKITINNSSPKASILTPRSEKSNEKYDTMMLNNVITTNNKNKPINIQTKLDQRSKIQENKKIVRSPPPHTSHNDFEDFDDFVSFTSNNAATSKQSAQQLQQNPLKTNNHTSLPPGFSISLQPKREGSSTPTPSFSENNTGSLI